VKIKVFSDDTALICKLLPPFRNNILSPRSCSKQSRTQYKDMFMLDLQPEDGSKRIIRSFGNYLPIDMVSYTMRLN